MGSCNLCSCPGEGQDSGQINFSFLRSLFISNNNITTNNNTNLTVFNSPYETVTTRNYNLNLFSTTSQNQDLTTLEQIKLSNQEKKDLKQWYVILIFQEKN